MNDRIRVRSGEVLSRTIADYDASRPKIQDRTLRAVYRRYRAEFGEYILDEKNCKHCVRQCVAGSGSHVFAVEQFDGGANDDPVPACPKRLIFRLNSTCNLACIMCDGMTSSRIRRERDKLPPTASMYGERFFTEHVRIFEILAKVKAKCTIYVNTNAVSLHPKARSALEALNFKTIAISMDAFHPELHGEIRGGLRSEMFFANVEYFLELREKKAGFDFLQSQRAELLAEFPAFSNLRNYDFMLSLIRSEIDSRSPDWKPVVVDVNLATDGLLAVPRPGLAPFETPAKATAEAERIVELLDQPTATRMLGEMLVRVRALPEAADWTAMATTVECLIAAGGGPVDAATSLPA